MLLYFEFEDKRRKAEVTWPKNDENIIVHITDAEITKALPTDLYFEIDENNKVSYITEDSKNKRLVELQFVLQKRLQELVRKL